MQSLLDLHLDDLPNGAIVVVTSKIVSLCEGRVVQPAEASKAQLIEQESERYLTSPGVHGFQFTIAHNTLVPAAGIDESNVGGGYLLWPADPQASANAIRHHLRAQFGRARVGVIISDSTCSPLRRGTSGIAIAHSGFRAVNSYIGQLDLFGRPLKLSESNIAGGLAAAAVVLMGEGSESTPLCIIEDVPFVEFQDRNPTPTELAELAIPLEEDLFEPFLTAANWATGKLSPPPNHAGHRGEPTTQLTAGVGMPRKADGADLLRVPPTAGFEGGAERRRHGVTVRGFKSPFLQVEAAWRWAFEAAWTSWVEGSLGIGCVLVDSGGSRVVQGRNRVLEPPQPGSISGTLLAHAEMDAFAGLGLSTAEGLTLFTTVEPCLMCSATAIAMRLSHVRFAAPDPVFEGLSDTLGAHPYASERQPTREALNHTLLAAVGHVLPLTNRVWSRHGVDPRPEWLRANSPSWLAASELIESGTMSTLANRRVSVDRMIEAIAPTLQRHKAT